VSSSRSCSGKSPRQNASHFHFSCLPRTCSLTSLLFLFRNAAEQGVANLSIKIQPLKAFPLFSSKHPALVMILCPRLFISLTIVRVTILYSWRFHSIYTFLLFLVVWYVFEFMLLLSTTIEFMLLLSCHYILSVSSRDFITLLQESARSSVR
jgi:hypothetical protein